MSTLGEELPKEQARCRELAHTYRSLPNNAGVFAVAMIEHALRETDKAVMAQDIVAMIACYNRLRSFE